NISGWLIALFLFIPTLSLSVRRFHDTGLSGKIVLFEYIIGFPVMVSSPFDDKFYDMTYDNIYAITFVGLFCLLVAVISIYVLIRCGFYKTQKGENKYGAALEVAKL
ncbi:MAG: DUF805 domain-containing protein, partial [Parvibaculales bacterium]